MWSPGCSLNDAFKENWGGSTARREERKKAKKCRGPALDFLSGSNDKEAGLPPDAEQLQSSIRSTQTPPFNRITGMKEHAPVDEDVGTHEPFVIGQQPRTDGDPIGDKVRSVIPRIPPPQLPSQTPTDYFGAQGPDDSDNFASFGSTTSGPNDDSYSLQPDFSSAFSGKGTIGGAGASSTLPVPSVNDFWKPLTPANGYGTARSSFFNNLPAPGGRIMESGGDSSIHTKLDRIFSRLDELESTKSSSGTGGEHAQTEILLFIMSGIFVLFMTDLAVRRGNTSV